MYNDFIVKVHRYGESSDGSRVWDGWYYSKVYAIDGDEFLVYDNGDMSAYNGEEDFCETGFNWVDFTATMDRCGESGRQPMVEPLVPFDIVEFMADRKTEPKQEWIPCSERLPSDGQCVIIQYFDTVGKNHISVVGAYYNERQGFVDTGYGEMWFGNGNDDVLAWMPLPKPWKGTDDEID